MLQQSLTERRPPTTLGCVNALPVLLHLRALDLGDAYRKISRYNESLCYTKAEQDSVSPDILCILFYGKKIVIECHCHKIPDRNNNTEGGFHGGRLSVSKGSQFIVVGKERKAL